jgi:large subunit ribosomal protein L19
MANHVAHVPVYPPLPSPPTTGLIELLEKKNIDLLDPKSSRRALFNQNSKSCLPIGSVVEIETWEDYPANTTYQSFAGHMIAIRRRGIDTSFRLRTVLSRVGVEQVFKLFQPNIKAIRVLFRGAVRGRRYKRAKLYFTRTPGTRNTLGGVEGVAKKARIIEKEAKDEQERILAKKGKLPAQPEPDAKVPKKKK